MEYQQDRETFATERSAVAFQSTSRFSPWRKLEMASVRNILNITAKEQVLDEEGLHTLLCEAEAIINSRPIPKASSDHNNLETCPIIFCCIRSYLNYHQEYFIRMINMPIADGDKFSTLRICSVHDGAKKTSPSYRNVNDGLRQEETSVLVTWC